MPPGRAPGLEIDMAPRRLSPFSTVASKVLIALTGLSLVGFLCVHLIGNLLLYLGPAKFNAYSHALISNPLVIPAEIGLAAIFLLHVLEASLMWFSDRRARPLAYQQKRYAGGTSRKSWASSTMIWTGSTTLVFLVVHVGTMKYGAWYTTIIHGEQGRDLNRLVVETFRNPLWVAFYAVCMVVVGFHLSHGFSSAFESLGIDHPKLTPKVLMAGKVLAILLGAGFFSIPIYLFFFGGRS
jgi:succinate dehydrogenase / fumarate reductase, cytochrome b subunit